MVGFSAFAVGLSLSGCAADPDPITTAPESSSTPTQATTDVPAAGSTAPETAESAQPNGAASPYADGTHEARGWYGGLPSHQDVTLTLSDGVVEAVEITTPAEDNTSLGYQQRFAEALPGEIVGRPIDELDNDRLAGSSGCSEGFMNALAKIKADASA